MMPDREIEAIETGQESMGDELKQLKTEMIGRVIEKMREKNKDDAFLYIGEDLVVDYLLDEGELSDKINDAFLGMGIDLFSTSAEQLKDLREKIRVSNTKEKLENLEKSIIENLDKQIENNGESTEPSSSGTATTGASSLAATGGTSASYASYTTSHQTSSNGNSSTNSDITSGIEVSPDSAKVGEAKEVPLKKRMAWLFPEGAPTKEREMRKYLTKIKVPILTADGKKKKLTLHIHKKLANEYKAIFQEMYDKKIPVNPNKTGGYNWRTIRRGKKLSHHSYGSAVDVNWDVNGGVYGKTDKNSPYYNDHAMVNIWKKHGFYRGGDWSAKSDDPMHFTYMNG